MRRRLDAFLFLCKCLSPGSTGKRHDLLQALTNSRVDWESLVEISSQHLLCAALYRALDQERLLSLIPEELLHYLSTLYNLNCRRNFSIATRAAKTIKLLNEIGVEPVLLKGIANLFSGLYADPNTRVISDIDLLIPEDKLVKCVDKLMSAGYRQFKEPETAFAKKYHHYPPLVAEDESIAVELHYELFVEEYRSLLGIEALMKTSTPLAIGETHARLPSASHRVFHNIAHAQLGHRHYSLGEIDLRHLYDFVLLKNMLGERIEWIDIASRFSGSGFSGALEGYLQAARIFFGEPLPPEIRAGPVAKLYCKWLCLQQRYSLAMWMGQTRQAMTYCRQLLQNLLRNKHFPRFWTLDFYSRNYRRISFIYSRRW
jgi:hypothetical protein